ncbi:MAG: PKD domain-containing protein, partial [Flavipsychrobacter sp.]
MTASFTADKVSGCAGAVINFTSTSTGATSLSWDFGNGNHGTGSTGSATYPSPGHYVVTLTATAGSASATDTLGINIYDTPRVNFTVDTAVCVGASITFTDATVLGVGTASGASYNWSFGNGDGSSAQNPVYPGYSTSGYYTITLTVTNSAGCQSVARKPNWIHVYGPPNVNFSASPTVFCGTSGTASFTSTISGGPSPYTYKWDFGDGSALGSSANPSHSYSSTHSSYDVKLVVTSAAGCKDSLTIPNYITFTHETASFTMTPPTTVCAGSYVTVTNTSTPSFTTTSWDFGDGYTSGGNPEVHAYASAGNYTIKLTSSNGCVDSIKKTITVNPQPKPDFTFSPTAPCPAPDTIIFTNGTTGSGTPFSYKWDFGDTSGSTAVNPHHYYLHNGTYDVKLIATNSYGCTDSVIKFHDVTISPLIVVITGNGTAASIGGCKPFTVNFAYTASNGVTTYPYSITSVDWDFGDGSAHSSSGTPTHIYSIYGTYTVKLNITTSNGCSATDSFTVHVGSHPTASFYATPTTACIDEPVTFHNTSDSATDYSWLFGDGVSIAADSPMHIYHDAGIYTVTLIAYNNGCPDTMVKSNYITI